MKQRSPIRKLSEKRLKSLDGKIPFSSIRASSKRAIRKVNPKAKAKRKIGYRKMLASPEYKAARKEAMERADGRCEAMGTHRQLNILVGRWRCEETEGLHAHHACYPKTRPLRPSDLLILCEWHHALIESQKFGKTRMF